MTGKWYFTLALLFFLSSAKAQMDSIRVVIGLDAANDEIETSYGFWEARAALEPKMDMYGFVGGRHLAFTFDLKYDLGEDAWVVTVPHGYYELRIESLGFTNILIPLRLQANHREELKLQVDSTAYTYSKTKRYNYIEGTRNFTSTVLVQFKGGDAADNLAYLQEALLVDGLEHLSILRIQKLRLANAFLVNIAIADRTPLNILLYRKLTKYTPTERGYVIGGDITTAIEEFLKNPNVLYATPGFLNDQEVEFKKSGAFTKSDRLERKLQGLLEEDPTTYNKIQYIIEKTDPKDEEEEETGVN